MVKERSDKKKRYKKPLAKPSTSLSHKLDMKDILGTTLNE